MREGPWRQEMDRGYTAAFPSQAEQILEGIRNGINIDFHGCRDVSRSYKNHNSTTENEAVIAKMDAIIAADCASGKTAGPFDEQPCEHFSVSPLGAVAKGEKIRKVHDLSHPKQGDSINAGVAEKPTPIGSFDQATEAVRKLGRNCWLIKLDVEAAYRQVPVRIEDRPLLGFKWRGKYYYDRCLPFGLKSSCRLWELYATALHYFLQHTLGIECVIHYVDDFLFVVKELSTAQSQLLQALQLCSFVGLPMSAHKTEGPVHMLIFLGIELDTAKMEARLGVARLASLRALLTAWVSKTHATVLERQELAGILNFACTVVRPGRTFLHRIIRGTAILQKALETGHHGARPYTKFPISQETKQDINWWHRFAVTAQWNGIGLLYEHDWLSADKLELYTDACNTGYGGYYRGAWFRGEWSASDLAEAQRGKRTSMPYLELRAVVLAAEAFGRQWRGQRIIFRCDCSPACAALVKGYSKTPEMAALLRRLHFIAAESRRKHAAIPPTSARSTAAARASTAPAAAQPNVVTQLTPGVAERYYLSRAIAPTTRNTYTTATENYFAFCRSNGIHDYSITANNAAAWIASLGGSGKLAASTIKVYLSALSTAVVERSIGTETDTTNPTNLAWVRRVMDGIANDRATIDAQHRAERAAQSQPLTLDCVLRIREQFDTSDPYQHTLFAAIALGVGAVLRPNALLGQPKAGLSTRGVMVEHLTFFRRDGRQLTRGASESPDHLTLLVPIDKNDQLALGQTRTVSAPSIVTTVWTLWSRIISGRLFLQPSGTPLWPVTLMKRLKLAMIAAGEPDAERVTAKCFRKGGASTLADAGAADTAIANAGGWRSDAYLHYLGPQQHQRRQLATSRTMESEQ